MIRLLSLTLLLAVCLGASGCGSLLRSDAPATTQWWLVPSQLSESTPRLQQPLVVSLKVVPGLNTERILNLNENARLNSYSGAQWPDALPQVLDSLVRRSLESISDSTVNGGSRAGDAACLLQLEVREFFGNVNSNGVTQSVVLSIEGNQSCPEFQRPVSSRQTIVVGENRMGPIVAAFQQALDNSLQDLARQLGPDS